MRRLALADMKKGNHLDLSNVNSIISLSDLRTKRYDEAVMTKPLNLLRPRPLSCSSEDEPPRAVPIRRAALIQMCEDGVHTVVSHTHTVTLGKMPG